ncbi:MAG: DUF354 domain-containing protein [Methylococcaceae bacterium]
MIWFDFDNSPHVPLFRPIVAELQGRGEEVLITSRQHAQTEELLRLWNMPHVSVGTHGGKSKVRKIINLVERARLLRREVKTRSVTLAVSHGSRTQLVAAASMGIRTLVMDDYEYSDQTLTRLFRSTMLVPQAIPEDRLKKAGIRMDHLLRYDGFKEEIYLPGFIPDADFRASIGVSDNTILVTMRPPSISANYHDEKSEILFRECLEFFGSFDGVLCLIANRTDAELSLIPNELLSSGAARILEKTVDGLQLLYASDLVVSGGGTMNREAALLGVPTYSVFSGLRPAMDEQLMQIGKLKFLESRRDIEAIPIVARDRSEPYNPADNKLASKITDIILDFNARSR